MPTQKISSFHLLITEIQQISESHDQTHFWPTYPKNLPLIFLNLYQNVKNQSIWLYCSGNIVDLKTLQSHWPRTFWPIPQELIFSKSGFYAGQLHIIYTFILEQIQKNINGQIFQYIQKTILSSFFSTYFGGQKKFLKKIWLCHLHLHMSF